MVNGWIVDKIILTNEFALLQIEFKPKTLIYLSLQHLFVQQALPLLMLSLIGWAFFANGADAMVQPIFIIIIKTMMGFNQHYRTLHVFNHIEQ